MSLNEAVEAELPYLRREAESLMVDTVLVERRTGETTLDPDSLEEIPVLDEVYSGKARIVPPAGLSPRDDVAGGFEFGIRTILARLPIDTSAGIVDGDRLTVTAVGYLSDPDLVGMVATVRANLTGSRSKQRTLVAEKVS